MDSSEIRKLLINSLNEDQDSARIAKRLEEEGISYDFSNGFTGRVINRLSSASVKVTREIEFTRYLNNAFSRVALTGVAAIVLLLISIFMMEGSLSFNSILGLGDTDTESIVCLLTGN